MKRTGTAAVVAALGLTLALTGAVAARNPHAGTHGGGHGSTKAHAHGKTKTTDRTNKGSDRTAPTGSATVAANLWVKGNTSHPGGTLRIVGLVQAPTASRPDSVDAVVTFASGPVSVTLVHNGNGHGVAYHGTAEVPSAEPAGKVKIDVTATVAGQNLTGTGWGAVVSQDGSETGDEDANDSPEPSETPEASEAPEESEAPEASESPEESEAPEASETPEVSDGDEDGDGDNAKVDAAFVRSLIAYLQTLID
jgi:hypothetical protein